MSELWIAIAELPADGREFSFPERELWAGAWSALRLPGRVGEHLSAELRLTPQGRGVLVTGRLTGSVVMPCDRCCEDCPVPVDVSVDRFEEPSGDDDLEESLLREVEGELRLDAAGLLWEELMLALPVKPLCHETCKGLCPHCGVNLNQADCGCREESGDPRMAVFRNIKLS
ncbi:MAG: DUF177 domain-containing protein [Desulfovibrionaceae bacterium]